MATKNIQSIDEQYLAKKRKNRIITNSIILSVCLILAIAIILLACLRIDLKPKFDSTAEYVEIKVDSRADEISMAKGDQNYDEFINIYNNSLSTSILTSIFTGNYYGYTVQRLGTGANDSSAKFYESYSNGVGYGTSSTLSSYLGSNYVHLKFSDNQYLYNSDGSQVMCQFESTTPVYYKDVYFTISSDANNSEINFYFGVTEYAFSAPRIIKISIEAQSYALYDFATNM